VEIPFATAHTQAYLVAEGAPFTASTPAFDKKVMKAYKVGALAYITHEAMQDMFLDMEAWIREDFGTAFADLEEEHFLTGAGTTMPSGLIPNAALGVTAAAAAALTADELLDLMYSVNQKYRSSGVWLMNDSTVLKIRKLKGSDGQYLWQPSIQDGQPDRLLSRPLYTSDTMPEATAGNAAVLFGDFKRYRILDRKGLYFQRLNEIAATSGQVGFLAYRRYDAALLNTDAVKKLVMKSLDPGNERRAPCGRAAPCEAVG
jgi:HK97 family phage major capsid protein